MIKKIADKFKFNNDTGLSNQVNAQGGRLINTDGSFNVSRKGLPFGNRNNFFHDLISMSWQKFLLVTLTIYVAINVLFAFLFYFIGIESLYGLDGANEFEKFLEAFFFSTQTFVTVGYGRINPTGIFANSIASLEALIGVMSLALMTGILYARFSRAKSKLMFSENILVSPYEDYSGIMFRMANPSKDQLIECEVQVMMSFVEEENGKETRQYLPLKLERGKISALALSWTVVHPLDEESPLINYSPEDYQATQAEFVIMFKAYNDTYSQTVHTRYSYKFDQMVWGEKFKPMYRRSEDGMTTELDFNLLNKTDEAQLPLRLHKAVSK